MNTPHTEDSAQPGRSRWWAWDRWDNALLEGLLLIITLGALIFGILETLDVMTAERLAVAAVLDDGPTTLATSDGDRVTAEEVQLSLTDPAPGQRLLVAAPTVLGSIVVATVGWLLWEVVRSLRLGDPFHRTNARRLSIAAVMALVGGMATTLIGSLASITLAGDAPDSLGLATAATLSFVPVGVGIVLAAVGEVFRRGAALRDEVEGLV